MKTEPEKKTLDVEIVDIVKQSGVEESTQIQIVDSMREFSSKVVEWAAKAEKINVSSIDQKEDMKIARESRLAIAAIRIDAIKKLTELKDDALKRCQSIDAVRRIIEQHLKPIEAKLKNDEEFAKRWEAEEAIRREQYRAGQLMMVGANPKIYRDLGAMGEDDFSAILEDARRAKQARDEAEAKAEAKAAQEAAAAAEAARIKAEQDQLELDRLRKEKEARDKKEAEEKAKRDADEKARKDAEAKAEAERLAAHRAVLARQIAMEHVGGTQNYEELKAMSEQEFKDRLAEAKAAKARAGAQAEKERQERAAEKAKLDAQQKAIEEAAAKAKAEAEAKAKAEAEKAAHEAEMKKRLANKTISTAAAKASEAVITAAAKFGQDNPEIPNGAALFVESVIRNLQA